ncbi:MAG: hypothetical protein AAF441_04120 [Pseudomonadota bacterium]
MTFQRVSQGGHWSNGRPLRLSVIITPLVLMFAALLWPGANPALAAQGEIAVQYRLTPDSPFVDVKATGTRWNWVLRRGKTAQGCFAKLAERETISSSKTRTIGSIGTNGAVLSAQAGGTKIELKDGGLLITGSDIDSDYSYCLETEVENIVLTKSGKDNTASPSKGKIIFRHVERGISLSGDPVRNEVAINLDARRLTVKHSAKYGKGLPFTVTSAKKSVYGTPLVSFSGMGSLPGKGKPSETAFLVPTDIYTITLNKTPKPADLSTERVAEVSFAPPSAPATGTVRFVAVTTDDEKTSERIESGMRYTVYKAKDGAETRKLEPTGEAKEVASSEAASPIMALPVGRYVVVARIGFAEKEARFDIKKGEFVEVKLNLNVGSVLLASKIDPACSAFGGIYHILYDKNVGLNGERLFYDESDRGKLKLYLHPGMYEVEYKLAHQIESGKALKVTDAQKEVAAVAGKREKIDFTHVHGCATFSFLSNSLPARKLPVRHWQIYQAKLSEQKFKAKVHPLKPDPNKADEPLNPGTLPLEEKETTFTQVVKTSNKPVATLGPRQKGIILEPRFVEKDLMVMAKVGPAVETKVTEGYLAVATDTAGRRFSRFFTLPEKKKVPVRVGVWHSELAGFKPLPEIGF